MSDLMEPTLYARFSGGWCDNCEIAAKTKACPDCGQPMRPAQITVEPADVVEVAGVEPVTAPATCALGEGRSAVECSDGPLNWQVRYFVGKGRNQKERGVSDPMCRAHAWHEEQWTHAVDAIRYGVAEQIQEG